MTTTNETELKGLPGDHISKVADKAVVMVAGGRSSVSFKFNDVTMTVLPGMTTGDVVADYHRQCEEQLAAYEASPEAKERKRAAEEAGRVRDAKLTEALADAPPSMSLRDEAGWKASVAANQDGYGGAVMTYAERWARLMEGALAKGETLAACADKMSSLADVEGITGFMYGCAVSILAKVWTHGEDLRRWHNVKTQIGTEGEKANESG